MKRKKARVAAVGIATIVAAGMLACSLIVDSDQCKTDSDCASRGAGFRNTLCQEGICILPAASEDASSDGVADGGRDAADLDADADVTNDTSTPGNTCSEAVIISSGAMPDAGMTLARETTLHYTTDFTFGSGCAPAFGPDRAYKVTVPDGKQLTVGMTPSSFDGVVNIDAVDGPNGFCPRSIRCASGARRGGTSSYLNAGGQAASVFILVAGAAGDASGDFDLAVHIDVPPVGESCRNPIPIDTVPSTLTNQTSLGFGNNYNPAESPCAPGLGPDVAYKVKALASKTLSVTVTPVGAWRPSVNIVSTAKVGVAACDAPPLVCVGSGAAAAKGAAATAQYTNSEVTDDDVIVLVDSVDTSGAGNFTLLVTD